MNFGCGSSTMEVMLNTPLNRVMEFVPKGRIHSLYEPELIDLAPSADVKLSFGDRAKVDALESTFTDSSEANGDSE